MFFVFWFIYTQTKTNIFHYTSCVPVGSMFPNISRLYAKLREP